MYIASIEARWLHSYEVLIYDGIDNKKLVQKAALYEYKKLVLKAGGGWGFL